jgi:DNA-binding CsgD family transcriptional regulator
MSYFNHPYNQNKNLNQEGKLNVILRIPKYGTPPILHDITNSNVSNNTFSTSPKQFYDAISYITYPGIMPYKYLINTRGCIFEANTGKLHDVYKDMYYTTRLLTIKGTTIKLYLHRLVAFQFCNPPINFKNLIVNHINGDKYCDFANNLEWVTVSANNQHARILYAGEDTCIINGRPLVDEKFVRYICKQFELGKSNTEIMKDLGMEINNANHTLLRDIRGGYTWKNISSEYNFAKSSKKHAYTEQEKDQIKQYMIEGKSTKEIFKLMQGREYIASTDRKDSSYRTIQSIRSDWFDRFKKS